MDTTTSNTGQGAAAAVTSSTEPNAQGSALRSHTLADLIDAYMAAYAGADRGIGTRLAYWRDALGARFAADIVADDIVSRVEAQMRQAEATGFAAQRAKIA